MYRVAICVAMAFVALAQVSGYTIEVPKKEVVHVFKDGDSDNDLSFSNSAVSQPYFGPMNLRILANGNLLVSDNVGGQNQTLQSGFQVPK